MNYQTGETTRLRRQRVEQAIQLALESRWKEAAAVNRSLISMFPSDVDAYNRLGKALMEMGEYDEARIAYQKALGDGAAEQHRPEEPGAAGGTRQGCSRPSARTTGRQEDRPGAVHRRHGEDGRHDTCGRCRRTRWARLTAGETVELRPQDNTLAVVTADGEYVGQLEPKLGLRLLRLMQGGNRYVAAVASLSEQRVIIREIYQHPSQQGRPSFPADRRRDRPTLRERPAGAS